MSSLPILQYCGRAADFDDGSGRAAAMSTAFHAWCAGKPEARMLLDALTEEEREEVLTYLKPEPLEVMGFELSYEDADTEFPVGLTAKCEFPDLDDTVEFTGHPDMGWVIAHKGRKVAVIGDIKRSRWTTPDGPASLQLQAYGLAWAMENDCDGWVTAIWAAIEGGWTVGDVVWLNTEAHHMVVSKMRSTLLPGRGFSTGSHCSTCYARTRCPAHMVRIDEVDVIAGVLKTELDNDSAVEALIQYYRMVDTAKKLKEHLEAFSKENDGIYDGFGKVWKPVQVQGRESVLSAKALREQLGEAAEHLITRGKPFYQYRWVKE